MESIKTVNLMPDSLRPVPRRSPVPSLVATLLLTAVVTAIGALVRPEPRRAAAQGGPPPAMVTDIEVAVTDAAHEPLQRAARRIPWHRILARVCSSLGDSGTLAQCRFDEEAAAFEISGEVAELSEISDLVLDLADWSNLRDPEPERVNQPPGATTLQFDLRFSVHPSLELREVP